MIKKCLNPEGHQNSNSGSKVTAILLKGWILPIGEDSAGEGLRLQPAQQACFNMCVIHRPGVARLFYKKLLSLFS